MIAVGDWRHVLRDVAADVVICDPPYGSRTHAPSVTEGTRYDGSTIAGIGPAGLYAAWQPEDVYEFVGSWSQRCRGWIVSLTSHDLIPHWERAYEGTGARYCFAPIPCVMRGMSVRLAGDGPSNWTVYAIVARPSTVEYSRWGTLDGAYVGPRGSETGGGRGKPDWLMRAIVRDYSKPGDLVVDPFAGWGSTLSAAIGLGRKALGAEIDPVVAAEAERRLARGVQTDMFEAAP